MNKATPMEKLHNTIEEGRIAIIKEDREKIKELIAHSSYNIDAGGRVSKRTDDAETICHQLIKDINNLPI